MARFAGLSANNSFKPNLLRYTNNMAGKACHVVGSATQVGLTQALCGGHQELLCAGKALLNRVPNVDSAVILARPVLDLGLRNSWAEQFAGLALSRDCVV